MALFPLQFPPGMYNNGTEYQGKGRWKDGNLVRFYEGTIQPIGGWRAKSTTTLTGLGRAIITWAINDSTVTWCAVGTESHLYAMTRGGVVYDITPDGFTSGMADAGAGGGYGGGLYGVGLYGTPRLDSSTIVEASMWTLDTFGQDLVGCMVGDGIIYEWALDSGAEAEAVDNAPTADAIFVTSEGMLAALGAEGVPRRLKWSSQRNATLWAADATNSAGDYDLQTGGKLLQGIRTSGTHILLTTTDAWTMTYTPTDAVYSIKRVGDGCGGASRNSGLSIGNSVVWMGLNGFWIYNGFVVSLPCDVWDDVFNNINRQQMSKVTCYINTSFNEVTWNYPSGGSTEIDSTVTWNFKENHWTIGHFGRLAGCDRGIFQYPLQVSSDGYVYEHEVGNSYDSLMPYLESGPFDILDGSVVQYAQQLIPDELTQGQVTATFKIKFAPEDTETSFGPYTLSKYTDVRFCGRQARLRYDGAANASWRVGTPRLEVSPGGSR